MKELDQNIAIMEYCGWFPHPENNNPSRGTKFWTFGGKAYGEGSAIVSFPPIYDDGEHWFKTGSIPNYCNDLNLMHQAEERLTEIQCVFYRQSLKEILTDVPATRFIWHATAKQRAQAFLRIIGKWKDTNYNAES